MTLATMVSRRLFLQTLLAGLGAGAASANAPLVSLRPRARPKIERLSGLQALLRSAGLQGEVACAVADAGTGLRLEAENGTAGLPPASVAKALTALYALDTLGPEHRFETRLIAAGPVSGGVLQGDLVLAGGGDPSLDTNDLAALAARLKEAGIREVRGKFLVWDGLLPYVQSIDPGQPDHVGYSPAVSGLALNFNRVHFEWKRASSGWTVTMDARTEKYRPETNVAKMAVAARKTPVYTYTARGKTDHWSVAQSALGNGGARWLPVRQPALYAGDIFRTMARSNGIVLKQPKAATSLPAGNMVAAHRSQPLNVLLKAMLKYSNNLMAEMIGMMTTVHRGSRPGSLKDSAGAMSGWAAEKYGMAGTALVDHSGLGDRSRMTPDDLVGALVAAHRDGRLRPLLKPFHLRDAKGNLNKSHPIKVAAKTGTLNFVSGLGGFMTAADGTELAFAIFTAHQGARANIPRAERERPKGARSWNRKSRKLQQMLIERWGRIYGS